MHTSFIQWPNNTNAFCVMVFSLYHSLIQSNEKIRKKKYKRILYSICNLSVKEVNEKKRQSLLIFALNFT